MTPWTLACQVPLSMGFPRQEYSSGLLFPFPEDLPDPGTELGSPTLQMVSFPTEPPRKPSSCSTLDYLMELFIAFLLTYPTIGILSELQWQLLLSFYWGKWSLGYVGIVLIPIPSPWDIIDLLLIFFTFLNSQRLHWGGEESLLYSLPTQYHSNICKNLTQLSDNQNSLSSANSSLVASFRPQKWRNAHPTIWEIPGWAQPDMSSLDGMS